MGCSAGMASPSSWLSVCSICAEFSFIPVSFEGVSGSCGAPRGPPTCTGGLELNDQRRPAVALVPVGLGDDQVTLVHQKAVEGVGEIPRPHSDLMDEKGPAAITPFEQLEIDLVERDVVPGGEAATNRQA